MSDQDTATEPDSSAPEPAPEPEVAPETTDTTEAPEAPEAVSPEDMDASLEVTEELLDQPEVQPEPAEAFADPERDTVEVEINGFKLRVPAALKDGYMQHADYTTKTQELADKGRALESDREAFTQQAQTHRDSFKDFGALAHTDQMLEKFRKVDFQQLQSEDPDQAQQLGFEYQKLRDDRQQIVERIQRREYDTRVRAERENANRQDQLKATLARELPNYTPELHGELDQIASDAGFKPDEIAANADPRHYKILQLAKIGAEVLKRQRAATTQPAPKPVKPVPKIDGGSSPKQGVHDDLPIAEWMRREQQRVDKQATG